ncbi:MAG: hypothetical protein ETSY1_35265 [Candidatus Entotheonella factor]|uniref:Alpha/beta hydrolase domain-containing protein n=1 Tax=Entotheonella factor TaxID=1429438 RepID=W4L8L7_ENTF1|nr:alpha/beta hydrolase domain-containing protein [Candidatus Entotheonella palauensis]ETW94352.1 MAG: hypothetical protein ETSY1_35265 [Candidatus Entotheonella factor]
MALNKLDILKREPYEAGHSFGEAGPYERIDAIAHYAVDPQHPANQTIVDLDRAERGVDGKVHFSGDLTILMPSDPSRGNRALLMQVPNRGNRIVTRFNMTAALTELSDRIDPGDGFLFERGWTVAWCGWQWDVPRPSARIGLNPPLVPVEACTPPSQMQLRIQPDADRPDLPLTDQHVGLIGRHQPIAPADLNDLQARLLVRDHPYSEPRVIPRDQWCFARDQNGKPVPDDHHMWLDGGFKAGQIYDILYTPQACPVVGAGLLAMRDCTAYLHADVTAPTAGRIDHVIGEGQSQCGRFLRTFFYFGLNADESGRQVFDGVLAHIAGGRRGEFNHRYAQPSVQPMPSFGHLFPFADAPQTDPVSGRTAGLLDRLRDVGALPKIIYTDTAAEYWRGDAGLTHLDLHSGADIEPQPGVRRYLFAATQHGPGSLPFADQSVFGSQGANCFNIVDYRPLYRAALTNLLQWVAEGSEPPPSVFPRVKDGTAATRAEVRAALASIPSLSLAEETDLMAIHPLDLGKHAEVGIGEFPAQIAGTPYPVRVSAVDADGNETGGIRMPDVAVPVATHTGFNPRHPETGGGTQLLDYQGSSLPFAPTVAERQRLGDPRLSIDERYRDRDDYLARVRRAAEALVEQRFLLSDDIGLCLDLAAARYDACRQHTTTP